MALWSGFYEKIMAKGKGKLCQIEFFYAYCLLTKIQFLTSKSKVKSLQVIAMNNRTRTIFMLQAITSLRLASSMTMIQSPKTLIPYKAPSFARHFKNVPKYRLKLANLPTPLHEVVLNNSSVLQPLRDLNIKLIIKRDDMTAGTELGGNKVRKLEFLLADALDGEYDSVITIGGEQSNHCRATVSFIFSLCLSLSLSVSFETLFTKQ
jgi:hypothetical protein